MSKFLLPGLAVAALSLPNFGCMSRMVSEGMGAATGASGKAVGTSVVPNLGTYKSLRIEPITVAAGLQAPADMPSMLRTDLADVAEKRGLKPTGEPALKLSGEIIHYETADMVDTAIGPLAQVIVRAKVTDAQTGKVIAQGNLIGRSKATASSSEKSLAAGVGKALDKWLKEGGLKTASGKEGE